MPVIVRQNKSRFGQVLLLLWLTTLLLSGCQQSEARNDAPGDKANTKATATAVPSTSASPAMANDARPLIVMLGDSITAGLGVPREKSWTTLLQKRIDDKGLQYRVVNKGVSGDTSTGGLSRVEDALQGDVKLLLLELGGNDGLRGLPVPELKKNLAAIIQTAQKRNIKVILAGMEAPPNYGADYTNDFRAVYRDLAKQYKLPLIPFILQNVGGIAELNQPDGIHPNEKGSEIVMETVWKALEGMLK